VKQLGDDAMRAWAREKAERDKTQQERQRKESERARERYQAKLAEAREWAIPILNRVFGEYDWVLREPDVVDGIPTVKIEVPYGHDGYHKKTLAVQKRGPNTHDRVIGYFHLEPQYRFSSSAVGGATEVRNLAHLGELLEREREAIDLEMRNAD
jgi:hypothetical protein